MKKIIFCILLASCSNLEIKYPEPEPEYITCTIKLPDSYRLAPESLIHVKVTDDIGSMTELCKDSVERQGGKVALGCTQRLNSVSKVYTIDSPCVFIEEVLHGVDLNGSFDH